MNKIGIMQGRLSPSPDGLFQFFPADNWRGELEVAKALGFGYVEWLYDWQDKQNPIVMSMRDEIRKTAENAGVGISSICADYFMKNGFLGNADNSVAVLRELILAAYLVGAKIVVVPFLEELAIKSRKNEEEIAANIRIILGYCNYYGIKLAFETELSASRLKKFIGRFNSPDVGVCYDLGNTTSYGFDSAEDIRYLRNLVFEVHIKDRKIGSSQSVYLGQGDVDFDDCFNALETIGFNGPMILQAFRGDDYVADAKRQLEFVKARMEALW